MVKDGAEDSKINRIICIVDDDLDITILFREALQTVSGVTVFTFTDPILALEHFQVNEYAYVLVISDFKMPGLNGLEFLKKVKEYNRFVRTILMTAFQIEDKVFREYTKKKIINAFLQKPIGIHDLLKEVDTQLHSYEMQKNSFLTVNSIRNAVLYSDGSVIGIVKFCLHFAPSLKKDYPVLNYMTVTFLKARYSGSINGYELLDNAILLFSKENDSLLV